MSDTPRAGSAPSGPDRLHNVPVTPIRTRLGAALLAVTVLACCALSVLLELEIAGRAGHDALADSAADDNGVVGTLAGLLITGCALLALRTGEHRGLGWTLGAVGAFWATDGLAQSYVRLGLLHDEPLPGMTFATWYLFRFTALLPLTIVILPLLFPDGRFLRGAWGVAGRVTVALMALSAVAFTVAPHDDAATPGGVPPGVDPDPTTLPGLDGLWPVLVPTLSVVSLAAGVVVPVGTVILRHRRSRGLDRDRMRWLLWGVLTTALLVVGSLVVDLPGLVGAALFLIVALVPVAVTIALVDPTLVSIERLLGGTLVYGGLAVLLVAFDFAVLAVLTTVLGDALDQRQVVVVVLLVSVVLYGPLRQRLSSWVRRLALGDRENPYDLVAGLATTLESLDDGAAQLSAVARAVSAAFGVSYVGIEVERGSGERITATHGTAPAQTRVLAITYRGTDVGRLVLPARGLRSRLSRRDEQLLGDLVRQAATAARTSRLADELQENRERLVVAREEERRRIRRDLHDGLGPALGGVVFQLESARLLVDQDPETAKQQLAATTRHVQDVVADVRRLVHDLRPPALDDRGLVGALRQQTERLVPGAIVEAGELGTLSAAVEVAAYRIAGEAVTNVARHARAGSCSVRLEVDGGHLLVEVADDGVGIPPEVEAGVGLVSLRERAAELGGRAEITCPSDGGTLVRAWLPLRSAHE